MRRQRVASGALVGAVWLGLAALVAPPSAATPSDAPSAAPLVDPLGRQLGRDARDPSADPVPTPPVTPSQQEAPVPEPTPEPAPEPPAPGPDCAVLACVALTFDDGPGDYTALLLDDLAARGVPATFFVLGSQVDKHPDIVARMAAEGHAVGNHSWSHPRLTTLSAEEAGWQIDATTTIVQQTTGTTPTLVRPPYGVSNDTVLAVLAERGAAAIMWSVDTEDWRNRDVEITTQRALEGTEPGAIILMHDIHPTSVQAVPGIVDQLQAAGYTLVTVPELLGPTTPGQLYRNR
ncbi:MAG: polysaccharide deacetylase family protein [Micrococcales bacterium]|nr:polysaccharide deacetylase family protein [Micrococcales bacterium]